MRFWQATIKQTGFYTPHSSYDLQIMLVLLGFRRQDSQVENDEGIKTCIFSKEINISEDRLQINCAIIPLIQKNYVPNHRILSQLLLFGESRYVYPTNFIMVLILLECGSHSICTLCTIGFFFFLCVILAGNPLN